MSKKSIIHQLAALILSCVLFSNVSFAFDASVAQGKPSDREMFKQFGDFLLNVMASFAEDNPTGAPLDIDAATRDKMTDEIASLFMDGTMHYDDGSLAFRGKEDSVEIFHYGNNQVFARVGGSDTMEVRDASGTVQIVGPLADATSLDDMFKIRDKDFFCAYMIHPLSRMHELLFDDEDTDDEWEDEEYDDDDDDEGGADPFRDFFKKKCGQACLDAVIAHGKDGIPEEYQTLPMAKKMTAKKGMSLFTHYTKTGNCSSFQEPK